MRGLIIITLLCLSGCGQKGALYMPVPSDSTKTEAGQEKTASEDPSHTLPTQELRSND